MDRSTPADRRCGCSLQAEGEATGCELRPRGISCPPSSCLCSALSSARRAGLLLVVRSGHLRIGYGDARRPRDRSSAHRDTPTQPLNLRRRCGNSSTTRRLAPTGRPRSPQWSPCASPASSNGTVEPKSGGISACRGFESLLRCRAVRPNSRRGAEDAPMRPRAFESPTNPAGMARARPAAAAVSHARARHGLAPRPAGQLAPR